MGSKQTAFLTLALGILLAPAAGHTHGLFWADGDDGLTLMVGHHGHSAHGGEDNHPCPPELIDTIQILTTSWGDLAPADGAEMSIPPAARAAQVRVDWGWWVKTRDGSRQAHPDSVAGVLQAWRTRETLLLLKDLKAPLPAPAEQGLDLIPTEDLSKVHPGEKATFQVLLKGQPAADVRVAYQGKLRGNTDSKGLIRIKLREAGPQTLRAGLPHDIPGYDQRRLNYIAQLDFTLEEKK